MTSPRDQVWIGAGTNFVIDFVEFDRSATYQNANADTGGEQPTASSSSLGEWIHTNLWQGTMCEAFVGLRGKLQSISQ
jgi:hypothetical protein